MVRAFQRWDYRRIKRNLDIIGEFMKLIFAILSLFVLLNSGNNSYADDITTPPMADIDLIGDNVVYPVIARKAGVEGKVLVEIVIDTTGRPKDFRIEYSDSPLLNKNAIMAIKKGKFTPAYEDTTPVECKVVIPINFVLRGGEEQFVVKSARVKREKNYKKYLKGIKLGPYPDVDDSVFCDKEPRILFKKIQKYLVYPYKAWENNVEGNVKIKALIRKDGMVQRAFIEESTSPLFDQISLQAVFKSRHIPALRSDTTINYWTTISIDFKKNDPFFKKIMKKVPNPDDFIPVDEGAELIYHELLANIEYPEEAVENDIEGTAYVNVLVWRDGSIRDAYITVDGNKLLDSAALEAVWKTVMKPAKVNNKKITSWLSVPVMFLSGMLN